MIEMNELSNRLHKDGAFEKMAQAIKARSSDRKAMLRHQTQAVIPNLEDPLSIGATTKL